MHIITFLCHIHNFFDTVPACENWENKQQILKETRPNSKLSSHLGKAAKALLLLHSYYIQWCVVAHCALSRLNSFVIFMTFSRQCSCSQELGKQATNTGSNQTNLKAFKPPWQGSQAVVHCASSRLLFSRHCSCSQELGKQVTNTG